jgi:hypothetical protein
MSSAFDKSNYVWSDVAPDAFELKLLGNILGPGVSLDAIYR